MIEALITAFVFAIYLYIKNGQSIDWTGIIISISVGFVGVLVFRFVVSLLNTPANIYRDQESEIDKITWNNVDIDLVPYSIIGYGSCVVIRIKNNKSLENGKLRIRAEIQQALVNGKGILGSAGRSLQYIDRTLGPFEERVKQCYFVSPPMQQGEAMDFMLARKIESDPSGRYEFDTYPNKDIPWPFSSIESPEFIIKCELQGNIEIGKDQWGLPHTLKYFKVTRDGKFTDITEDVAN